MHFSVDEVAELVPGEVLIGTEENRVVGKLEDLAGVLTPSVTRLLT